MEGAHLLVVVVARSNLKRLYEIARAFSIRVVKIGISVRAFSRQQVEPSGTTWQRAKEQDRRLEAVVSDEPLCRRRKHERMLFAGTSRNGA